MFKLFYRSLILMLLLVFSSYGIDYYNPHNVFFVSINKITFDDNLNPILNLNFENYVGSNLKFDVEVIYESEALVVGAEVLKCSSNCDNNINLRKTFFGKHKIIVVTKYENRFYKQEIDFSIDEIKPDYDMSIPSIVYLDPETGINLKGEITNLNSEEYEYFFEVFPRSAPDIKKVFTKTCSGSCKFNFNINSDIVIDDYLVNVYNYLGDTQQTFELRLPYEIQGVEIKKKNFKKYFQENSTLDLKEYFFYNNVSKKNVDLEVKFKKNGKEILKKDIVESELVDIEFNVTKNSNVNKIKIKNARVDNVSFGFENVPLEKIEDFEDPVNAFAFDPKVNSEVNSYELSFTATGNVLYKCVEYDFQNQNCFGNFVKVIDTIPGQNYTLSLTPEDPLFVEIPVYSYEVQKGLVIGSSTSFIDSINSINTSQSFVLINSKSSDSTPDDWQITPYMNSSTLVGFDRYSSTNNVDVDWQVISSNQFEVQNGIESLTIGTSSVDVTLNSVNLSESFVLAYGRCADSATADSHAGFFYGNLTNSTNLHLERGNAGKCAATVRWQVVDWTGANVQSGSSLLTGTGVSTSASISSINLSSSLVVFGWASQGTDTGMDSNLIRSSFGSSTQVNFDRDGGYTSSDRRIVYYVIEHPHISVDNYNTVYSSDTSEAISVTNLSRSFHVSSIEGTGGGQTYSNSRYTLDLTSSTLLSINKQTTSQTNTMDTFVVEFLPPSYGIDGELILNATSNLNLSSEDLMCNYKLDLGTTSVFENWLVDNNSIMVLGMPYEGGAVDSLIDYSNTSNNGVNNGAVWNSTGGYDSNGAFMFDGNSDNINISDSFSLDILTDITIMAWAKMAGQSINSDFSRIISKGQSTTSNGAYGIWVSDPDANSIGCRLMELGTNYDATLIDGTENDNLWHHYACTYDGSVIRLYVDGVEVSNNTVSITLDSTTDDLLIGDGRNQRHFNGSIDEVRIYNRSLSAGQINEIFKNNTNIINSSETNGYEQWQCRVTTFDSTQSGITYLSNYIDIVSTEQPQVGSVILNASTSTNYTSDDLICNYVNFGSTNSTVVDWLLGGNSIMNLNLPFEGNSSNALLDYSNNLNNGNFSNVVWNSTGGTNNSGAFEFNGISDQYVSLGESSSLFYDGDSNYTFSFWIKTTQSLGAPPLISDKDWTLGNFNGYSIHLEGNVCRINIGDGFNRVDLDGTVIVNDGNWHHCAFVLNDSQNVTLYVDGVYDGSLDMTSINNVNSSLPTAIGNDGTLSFSSTLFTGTLDNIQVYNRTLTQGQISNLYNSNYNLISSTETNVGDIWQCEVTPFDQFLQGITTESNNLTVFETPPQLNLTLVQPLTDIDVYRGSEYDIIFNASCSTLSNCYDVNVTLNYVGPEVIGESGSLLASNNNNYTIEFNNKYSQTPIILMTPVTDNGSDNNPLIPVVHSINTTHAKVSLCQDAGQTTCNLTVEDEEFHYYVFDIDKANGYSWIDVGTVNSINTNGAANVFNFGKTFSSTPYVFVQSQTYNSGSNAIAPHAWITSPSTTGANIVGCDHPGIGDICAGTSNEDYGYVAIDVTSADLTGLTYGTQSIGASTWTAITYGQTYTSPRLMVAQNSEAGAQDPQYPWAQLVTSTGADIRYCEADASGVCDSHSAETIVWMNLEEGSIETGTYVNQIVSNITDDLPMFVNSYNNPVNISLSSGVSTQVSFPVYFTGDFSSEYELLGSIEYGNDSNNFNITILPSSMDNLTLISPSDSSFVVQNETFYVNSNVSCTGYCGEINANVRYNQTTISNVSGVLPMYIMNDLQTLSCNPGIDGSCQFSWLVNATGDIGENYLIDVLINSSVFGLNDSNDNTLQIISGPEILFNQSFLNITGAIANYQEAYGYSEVEVFLFNQSNASVSCVSGDCSYIHDNFQDSINMSLLNATQIEFTCLPVNSGTSSALFEVITNEDSSPGSINVSCEASELDLYANLVDPDVDLRFDMLQNSTYNISMNVTCNTIGGCNNTELGLYLERETIGESGSVLLSNFVEKSIVFTQSYNSVPIVIPVPVTDNDADNNPLIPVITNITTTGFNIALCEDAGATTCSATVEEEKVHYFVFDVDKAGNYSWIDVGYVTNVVSNGVGNSFSFGNTFSNAPYVFVWSNTDNDGGNIMAPTSWVTTITTIGGSFFACDHPGIGDVCAGSTVENYSYVAIDFANANLGEISNGSASVSNSAWTAVSFNEIYTNPIIITSENTESGSQDPQYPWARNVVGNGADVRYCEADGVGDCDTHNPETMVWMAMEEGPMYVGNLSSSLVSTVFGDSPFFTTDLNPQIFNLSENTSQVFTFLINATGTIDDDYNMFGQLDNGVDTNILTVRPVGLNKLLFNQTNLIFNLVYSTEGIGVKTTNLSSRYNNDNVTITCESGNCSSFSTDWIDGDNLLEGQQTTISFICSDSIVGNFSAIFNITSNEADVVNTVNVSCDVAQKSLDIDLDIPSPLDNTNVTIYSYFNLTFNVTCHNASGCNDVGVYAAYEDESKPWWNRSWPYRQNLSLSSTVSSLFNYTFLLYLNSSDVGNEFNWNLVCSDLRFLDFKGVELNYWIEDCDQVIQEARIWIKTSSFLNSSDDFEFSMYYGNKEVTSVSNGYNTFFFFEDFENYNSTIDGQVPPTWTTYSSGVVNLTTQGDGNRVLSKNTNSDPNGGYTSFSSQITNYEAMWLTNRVADISGGTANRYAISNSSADGYGPYTAAFGASTSFTIEERAGGTGTTIATGSTFSVSQDTWYKIVFEYYNQSMNYSFYDLDFNLLNNLVATDSTVNSFERFYIHGGQEFWTDNIAIRKIISVEPTLNYGSEEASYSSISNSNLSVLWTLNSNPQVINLTDNEIKQVTFLINTTEPFGVTYEVLGVLSNGDKTLDTFINIVDLEHIVNLSLDLDKKLINGNLHEVNITFKNLANYYTPRNMSLLVYVFVSNHTNVDSSFVYTDSNRFNISISNETTNGSLSGVVYNFELVHEDTLMDSVFLPYYGTWDNDNSWNLQFNYTTNRTDLNKSILVGFDPIILEKQKLQDTCSGTQFLCLLSNVIQIFLNVFNGDLS